jgi:hypothetical protein
MNTMNLPTDQGIRIQVLLNSKKELLSGIHCSVDESMECFVDDHDPLHQQRRK